MKKNILCTIGVEHEFILANSSKEAIQFEDSQLFFNSLVSKEGWNIKDITKNNEVLSIIKFFSKKNLLR